MSASASGIVDRDRREFTARKWSFHDAVNLDPDLTALDLRVSWLLLSKYLNSETGTAWPAAKTLAEVLGVEERSVRRSIRRLVKVGWWRILHRGGRGRPNKYAPGWDHAKEHHSIAPEDPDQPVTETHASPAKTLTCRSESRTSESENPDQTVTGLPLKNPFKEPLGAPHCGYTTSAQTAEGISAISAQQEDRTQSNRRCQATPSADATNQDYSQARSEKGAQQETQKTNDAVPRETEQASRATATWSKATPAIKAEVGDKIWDAWLKDMVPLKDDGKTLVLGAASQTIAALVKANYGEVIERHTGRLVEVRVHNSSVISTLQRRAAAEARAAGVQATHKKKTGDHE